MSKHLRILILRYDNIGDLVCTTPLIAALREHFPSAWIGALVNTYNAEVLARNRMLDEVFVYEKRKHSRKWLLELIIDYVSMVLSIRRLCLDVVIVPAAQWVRFANILGASKVVVLPDNQPSDMHEVERTFETARELGITRGPGKMYVFPDPAVVEIVKNTLGTEPFVVIHISARRVKQQWPLERYAALACELARNTRVVLMWSPGPSNDPCHPGDDENIKKILKQVETAPHCGNIIPLPTLNLGTLIAAMSLARLVICPDGGTMHLAAALGKPVIALFGDSLVTRWRPWGVQHRVVQCDDLANLPLDLVLASVFQLENTE
jgi:heptosyltransferase-3